MFKIYDEIKIRDEFKSKFSVGHMTGRIIRIDHNLEWPYLIYFDCFLGIEEWPFKPDEIELI